MNPRLALRHCQVELLGQLREPGYLVQALIFPTMFFLFFGVAIAGNTIEANLVLASYATYAFLGVVFIQYTGGIAQSRQMKWEAFLRTLPASYSHRFVGWSLSGLIIGIVSLALVAATAFVTTGASAGVEEWLFLGLALLFGSTTMALVAMVFGYWLRPGIAVPISNVVYLSLAYAGGLWTSPEDLPEWLQHISPFLPTRLWAELAWASVQSQAWPLEHTLGLLAYLVMAAVMTRWGYLRVYRQRHGHAA